MACLALEEFKRKQLELDALAAELDQLRHQLDGRITASYSPIASHSGDGRGVEARAIHLADVETRYMDALDALAALRLDAEAELKQIDDDQIREILAGYYIDGWTVPKTAEMMNRTYRHIEKLKLKGLTYLRERTEL